jgi:hypothetical protein
MRDEPSGSNSSSTSSPAASPPTALISFVASFGKLNDVLLLERPELDRPKLAMELRRDRASGISLGMVRGDWCITGEVGWLEDPAPLLRSSDGMSGFHGVSDDPRREGCKLAYRPRLHLSQGCSGRRASWAL